MRIVSGTVFMTATAETTRVEFDRCLIIVDMPEPASIQKIVEFIAENVSPGSVLSHSNVGTLERWAMHVAHQTIDKAWRTE